VLLTGKAKVALSSFCRVDTLRWTPRVTRRTFATRSWTDRRADHTPGVHKGHFPATGRPFDVLVSGSAWGREWRSGF
jgi:hypothetical protein